MIFQVVLTVQNMTLIQYAINMARMAVSIIPTVSGISMVLMVVSIILPVLGTSILQVMMFQFQLIEVETFTDISLLTATEEMPLILVEVLKMLMRGLEIQMNLEMLIVTN